MQGPFTLSKSNRHNTISEDELQRFKTNYIFMWTALGTSPHLADSERDSYDVNSRIRGHEFLPSRATLFACSRDGYVPSRNTVFKIVDFFNANFTPAITPWTFLHEDLSESTMYKRRGTSIHDEDYIGVYNCYYPASREANGIFGAILKIYLAGTVLKAFLITSIRTDEAFKDPSLRKFFNNPTPSPTDFKIFQGAYTKSSPFVRKGRRYYYFEGNVEVTDCSILIVFRSDEGNDSRKLIFTMNTKRLPSERIDPYHGGLAFVMTTSDTPFGTRFYPMGVINSLYGFYSLQDEHISEALHLCPSERDIHLTDKADDVWNDLALAQRR
ncbi:hypothetical protein [uncultured Subdoligranulum sp.]|uniref:hypothetical protein n=1 Tax=uncultured Subdoligranulum sp. TaxID=512298 RepID=UPI00320A2804